MFKSERDGETMKQKNPINQEVEDGDAGWGLIWAVTIVAWGVYFVLVWLW